jgi:hypothetical protein
MAWRQAKADSSLAPLAIAHPLLKHHPHRFVFVLAAFTKKAIQKTQKKNQKRRQRFVVFLSAAVPRMYL